MEVNCSTVAAVAGLSINRSQTTKAQRLGLMITIKFATGENMQLSTFSGLLSTMSGNCQHFQYNE